MGVIFRKRKCYTGKVKEQPVYSTDEICIGTVDINGVEKKLYQKTWTGLVLPTTSTSGTSVTTRTALGVAIDEVYSLKIFARTAEGALEMPVPTYMSANAFTLGRIWRNGSTYPNTIELSNSAASWNGLAVRATIQYTKAT